MDPKEFERLKEAEKEHLRKMKEIKQKLHEAKRKKSLLDAVKGMLPSEEQEDTYNEMLERVQRDNIITEAKMEIALENAGLAPPISQVPQPPKEETEEELQKARAKSLVEQMKLEMGGLMVSTPSKEAPENSDKLEDTVAKTIGKTPIKSQDQKSEEAEKLPVKTIGRRKKSD